MAKSVGEESSQAGGESGQPHVGTETPRNFELLLDVPLEVTAEIGRATLPLRELLQLGPGSVVELAKLAGEPLDVFVNGRLVARGEAVMVNDKFGVRLTDIVSQSERIEGLR